MRRAERESDAGMTTLCTPAPGIQRCGMGEGRNSQLASRTRLATPRRAGGSKRRVADMCPSARSARLYARTAERAAHPLRAHGRVSQFAPAGCRNFLNADNRTLLGKYFLKLLPIPPRCSRSYDELVRVSAGRARRAQARAARRRAGAARCRAGGRREVRACTRAAHCALVAGGSRARLPRAAAGAARPAVAATAWTRAAADGGRSRRCSWTVRARQLELASSPSCS